MYRERYACRQRSSSLLLGVTFLESDCQSLTEASLRKWSLYCMHSSRMWASFWCVFGNVADLRWFPVRTAHSQEFVCVFCFVSFKTSQNVNNLKLLTWSKFKVSKPPLWMWSGRSFMLRSFSYHQMKQLRRCKNQWSCCKKNLKGIKYKVCDS